MLVIPKMHYIYQDKSYEKPVQFFDTGAKLSMAFPPPFLLDDIKHNKMHR